MKEIPKPLIEPGEPIDEVMSRLANYHDKKTKQDKALIDALPDCGKPESGPKYLSNKGHDKELKRRDTIHDMMAKNPALYQRLKKEFGQ